MTEGLGGRSGAIGLQKGIRTLVAAAGGSGGAGRQERRVRPKAGAGAQSQQPSQQDGAEGLLAGASSGGTEP